MKIIAADTKTTRIVILVIAIIPPFEARQSEFYHLIDGFPVGYHINTRTGNVSLSYGVQSIANSRNVQRNFSTRKGQGTDVSCISKTVKKRIDISFLNIDRLRITTQTMRTAHITATGNLNYHITCTRNIHSIYSFHQFSSAKLSLRSTMISTSSGVILPRP